MSTPNLVEAFYERIWNNGDLAAASDLLTDNFSFRGSLGTEMRGHETFTEYVRAVRAALADYRCEILECVAEGDQAFAKMRFSGRHLASFRGYQATGKPVIGWVRLCFVSSAKPLPSYGFSAISQVSMQC